MPHSLSQIKTLLARAGVRPRHRWGQNFLIDLNLMRFLIEAADIQSDDVILEVGHGTGSMTQLLAERARGVVAVDIDPIMADIAAAELAECANVTLIHGDILANKHTLNPAVIDAVAHAAGGAGGAVRSVKLVANLPYQIAAPLMMNLLIGPPAIDAMAVTIQREMADRMTAAPGHRRLRSAGHHASGRRQRCTDSHLTRLGLLAGTQGHLGHGLVAARPPMPWSVPSPRSDRWPPWCTACSSPGERRSARA